MGDMVYASKHASKSGASATQSPDAVTTSMPPAPSAPVPVPYPNMGISPYGNADQQEKVKAMQKSTPIAAGSGASTSAGDEPGTLKDVVSAAHQSKVPKVQASGQPVTLAAPGATAQPSQTKVIVGS